MIAAIVLAAGRATRMGEPKVLLSLGGRTLLAHVIAAAQASACGSVIVVAGSHAGDVRREAEALGAQVVVNPRYAEGMASSLAAGVAALPSDCEAAVVLLGDQPRVGAAAIDRLVAAYRATGKPMVLSRCGDAAGGAPAVMPSSPAAGPPALIARPLFAEVAALTGDAGARGIAARHPDRVAEVRLAPDEAWDVDTPDDFARLKQALEHDRHAGDRRRAGGSP
ncbi:MAG TPA: nucleotidyltransferase family protein [bacterium]|nr:nucleotidyltransferase family protein [bacterium]